MKQLSKVSWEALAQNVGYPTWFLLNSSFRTYNIGHEFYFFANWFNKSALSESSLWEQTANILFFSHWISTGELKSLLGGEYIVLKQTFQRSWMILFFQALYISSTPPPKGRIWWLPSLFSDEKCETLRVWVICLKSPLVSDEVMELSVAFICKTSWSVYHILLIALY